MQRVDLLNQKADLRHGTAERLYKNRMQSGRCRGGVQVDVSHGLWNSGLGIAE